MLNVMEFTTEEQWIIGITGAAKHVVQDVWTKEDRNCFLALTGGHTPKPLYNSWAEDAFFGKGISWWLGDERCVDQDSDERNEKMIFDTLGKAPWFAKNFSSWGNTKNPEFAAKTYEFAMRAKMSPENPCFDLIILGIGGDGHIASLFPNSPEIGVTGRLCVATQEKHMGHRRVSFTFPVLNNAKHIFFIIRGQEKKPLIEMMLAQNKGIPAGMIKASEQTLFWLQDHPI